MLDVALVGFFSEPAQRSATQLPDPWTTLGGVAEAACRAGVCASP
jgi:hypothetical protein